LVKCARGADKGAVQGPLRSCDGDDAIFAERCCDVFRDGYEMFDSVEFYHNIHLSIRKRVAYHQYGRLLHRSDA